MLSSVIILLLILAPQAQRLPQVQELRVSGRISISSVPAFGQFGFSQSDDDGNLYFHPDTGNYSAMNVLRISPRNDSSTVYALDGEREKDCAFSGFSVTKKSEVSMVVACRDANTYVYSFDSKGNAKSRTRLDVPKGFYPTESFLVFESGVIFASGYFKQTAEKSLQEKSFTALFEASGALRKQLRGLSKDVPLSERSKTFVENSVSLAPDDTFYVLQSDSITQVNQFGKVLRRLKFEKPDNSALATKLDISGNYACIWLEIAKLGELSKAEFLVMNLATGEPFRLYTPSEELGQNAVSFSYKEGFKFLVTEQGTVKLIEAQLR